MRLNKKLQLGLLLTFYLCRYGRTTVEKAATSLGVSETFLALVAHSLRKAKVISSVKGPNGGYEMNGEPLVEDVFKALNPVKLVSSAELKKSNYEYRTLSNLAGSLTQAMNPVMSRKIKNLVGEVFMNDAPRSSTYVRGSAQVN